VTNHWLIPALAGFALAILSLSSVALADSLTVDFGYSVPDPKTKTLSGTQTATTNEGAIYDGSYTASGTLGTDGCVYNATTNLDFPTTTPRSHLTLLVAKMCFTGTFSGTFSVKANSGTGIFAGANGGGNATYAAPDTITFAEDPILFPKGFLDPSPVLGAGSTPELDSLILFGTGSLGLAGYALMRLRARKSSRSV
jgi:hypothetical protein